MTRRRDDKPDLDALIVQAEHAVIERDRHLRQQADALALALRDNAGRLGLVGIATVGALAAGVWWLGRSRGVRHRVEEVSHVRRPPPAPAAPHWSATLINLALPLIARWWQRRPPARQ